jgi:hypothetical protein
MLKDYKLRRLFTLQMLSCTEKHKGFLDRICISNGEMSDMRRTVNRHNYGPHKFIEHDNVSPKVNV